jgi:hypothetical protein
MTRLLLSTAIVVALTASASAQFFNLGPKAGGSIFGGPSVTCPKGGSIRTVPANAFRRGGRISKSVPLNEENANHRA